MSPASAKQAGNSRGSALALGGLLVLVLGCCVLGGVVAVSRNEDAASGAPPAGTPAAAPRDEPASIDGPFHYAAVRRTPEPRPARFDAALPVGMQAFVSGWTGAHPPREHVHDRLCAGDRAMAERWLDAIATGPTEGSPRATDTYSSVLSGCEPRALCSWAGEVLGSGRPSNVLRPVWWFATHCEAPAISALFREREVPPEAYVEWSASQTVWGEGPELFQIGTLSAQVDVEKLAAAVDFLVSEADQGRPLGFERAPGMVLGAAVDPRAAETLLRLHAAARDDASRHELAMAMHAQRDRRARQLFEADCRSQVTPDALCTAPAVSLPPAPRVQPTAVPLDPAVFSRLRALGLLGTPKPGGPIAESGIELLEQSGRALRLERGGRGFTVSMLARLAAPVFDDVVFDYGEGGTSVMAWSRAERFETALEPALEWENLEAVVGLLNVLARSRGSSVRFVANQTDEVEEVVAGLDRSLRAAVAERLIEVSLELPPSGNSTDAFLRALRGEPVD